MSLETPGDVGARLDKLKDVRGQLVWRACCVRTIAWQTKFLRHQNE